MTKQNNNILSSGTIHLIDGIYRSKQTISNSFIAEDSDLYKCMTLTLQHYKLYYPDKFLSIDFNSDNKPIKFWITSMKRRITGFNKRRLGLEKSKTGRYL